MDGRRYLLKAQLEKERLELERKREEEEARRKKELAGVHESRSMDVPSPQGKPPAVTVEVPADIMQVRSQLAHPTNYHVSAIQKRQVSQYLSSQSPHFASHSAPTQPNAGFGHSHMAGNMASFSVRKDPMLSGVPSASPQQRSPVGTYDGGQLNVGGSPSHAGMLLAGSPSGVFVGGPQNLALKPESPTMMATETPENIQDQIIEDIMSLEEKFGDPLTAADMQFLDTSLMAPQTLPPPNLFDSYGMMGGAGGGANMGQTGMISGSPNPPMMMPQMSASCPNNVQDDHTGMHGPMDMKLVEKERQKKNNHNMIERRRRFNINDRIKELGMLLPTSDQDFRQNKGTILKASVDYIRRLQRDMDKSRVMDAKQRQLEEANKKMRLRIQELELTARAHGIPTPSLNPETHQLAVAADQSLAGAITPRSRTPTSACVTPFREEELADLLRTSPSIDFSRLNIKQESINGDINGFKVFKVPARPADSSLSVQLDSPSAATDNSTQSPLKSTPSPHPPPTQGHTHPTSSSGHMFNFSFARSPTSATGQPMDTGIRLFDQT
ncbi:Transcription factor E3 [Geodia barretti]|uniref:Transcription factor E3 n=1 Tax=Geodia barretti TaxID=519541 RepID=A0AA35RB95_GEOBA|nr:Transcription factor E3 [Geodia barretti]